MNEFKKPNHGFGFLSFGLYSFGGLGLEILLAFMIEPILYGKSFNEFKTFESISHWILTCIIWGIVAALLIHISKKKYHFDIFVYKNEKIEKLNWIFTVILLCISIIISIWDWNGFKVIKEFNANGLLKFIFQYIYYLFEIVLVVLIIAFGQQAGEAWFKNKQIPWGGILLGLTWGLVHMLTKGDIRVGLIACFGGLLYGITYLLLKKNIYVAYPIIFFMFVL